MYDVIIIGGGAAGFFSAIHMAEFNSKLKIAILEKSNSVLSKVKVSGGGRCNVTHAEFDPKELVKNYPRGEKELLGPFHTFCTGDTFDFFEKRGIDLKIEEDGRVFPKSNSSQTIIDCFLNETKRLGVEVITNCAVKSFRPIEEGKEWQIETVSQLYNCKKLMVASGSSIKVWKILQDLGHTLIPPVPSLFTFNIDDGRIKDIPGISTYAEVRVLKKIYSDVHKQQNHPSIAKNTLLVSEGPTLITHWGLSGPAILKLSAWGAKLLNEYDYKFKIVVNWMPEHTYESIYRELVNHKKEEAKKAVCNTNKFEIPKRLWISLVSTAGIQKEEKWADLTKSNMESLSKQLTECCFQVDGKSTFKEEFVTAGGVDLKEIDFKRFGSKLFPNLFFAGEVINIDAITGGFNFQNAWTGAYIAAKAIASEG